MRVAPLRANSSLPVPLFAVVHFWAIDSSKRSKKKRLITGDMDKEKKNLVRPTDGSSVV